jgi:C-terminal processing protease CtpA/Prc
VTAPSPRASTERNFPSRDVTPRNKYGSSRASEARRDMSADLEKTAAGLPTITAAGKASSESKDAEPVEQISFAQSSEVESISAAARLAELTPALGMSFRQIRSSAQFGLSDDHVENGLRVTGVVELGSADKAGILVGDVITRFAGKPTFTK